MNRAVYAVIVAAAAAALAGCGGGGGTSAAGVVSGSGSSTRFSTTGTFHFNQLPVTALTIQDESGGIVTPINPPQDAIEGERIRFEFRDAQTIPPFFRPLPHPVELLNIQRL